MIKITKLLLSNFRNFSSKKFEFSASLILLTGKNGTGKTSVLEALTLLGQAASLRGCDFDEMIKSDAQQFSLFAEISGHDFLEKIGLSFDLVAKKKNLQINGEPLSGRRQADLKNYLINFIFLTPAIEQLFISGKSERRDYLDKIVCDIDPSHSARINSYQKLLRERLLILQKRQSETWLKVVENQIVELGVAIASARIEAVDFFNKAILSFSSKFPKAKLQVLGEIEQMIGEQSAVQLEEFYKKKLQENRIQDLENFKTNFGVHRCDFDAIFLDKNISALRSSTGEQKAIMIGITLARAKISSAYKNQPTVLIFDEVVSHLDEERKKNLFNEIHASGLQTFFSATSENLIPAEFLAQMQVEKLS